MFPCRDDARNVLASMAAELGPNYLPFVLDVLETALPDKGYMGHIRGYTLHFLLEALNKVPPRFSLPHNLCCAIGLVCKGLSIACRTGLTRNQTRPLFYMNYLKRALHR